ncbi:MAG: type II toxin-antitoxin system VapC family toxin, partial [Candidatus Electrothrix sp. AR3]|nr:type II toxin-antitoxin system VapC family toxin [Candidatus Electrothrix sp. AR3]
MYLLDTNTLIYFFKDIGNVAETLLSKSPKNISIPSIVLYELEVGIAKSNNPKKRKKQLEALTSRITVHPFTSREAEVAAMIRADLEKQGTPIGPCDTLIAGTALSLN